jgi:hypothetical protein
MHQTYLFFSASFEIALPPDCISLPAPSTVLQAVRDATAPAKNDDTSNSEKILLIMMKTPIEHRLKNWHAGKIALARHEALT